MLLKRIIRTAAVDSWIDIMVSLPPILYNDSFATATSRCRAGALAWVRYDPAKWA